MTKKLEKVLEHLINGREDEAKELLHQVFIEKARAIHEDLINMEDEHMDMDGDMGEDFRHDVKAHDEEMDEMSKEIEAEETMSEDEEVEEPADDLADELDVEDDMMSMDDMEEKEPHAGDMGKIETSMEDLEAALADLKAEFEALEKAEKGEDEVKDADENADEAVEDAEAAADAAEEAIDAAEEAAEEEAEEEEMDESWLEEFDDLEEAVNLEKVPVDHGPEVGAGKFSSDVGKNAKSPTAKAPEAMFGAKPVQTGKGPVKSGFDLEKAPSAEQIKGMKADNRRKKAEDGTKEMKQEGDPSAKLNKTKSEFGADKNTKSPLTQSPRK